MTGFSKEELEGEFISKLDLQVDGIESFYEVYRAVDDTPVVGERAYAAKDGTYIMVEINSSRINTNQGEIIISTIRNITNRRKEENLFRQIIKQSPYGIALVDDSGIPTLVNKSLADMLGYTIEELTSIPFVEYTHPDDINENLEVYQEAIDGKRVGYTLEKRYITKTGNVVHANLVVREINDPMEPQGKKMLAIVKDTTNEKKAQLRYKGLIETAGDAIYLLDSKARITDVNRAAELMLGYKKEELMGQFMGIVNKNYAQDTDFINDMDRQKTQEPFLFESIHTHKKGVKIPVELNIRIVEIDGDRHYFAIARDISDRKRQEEKLKQNNALLAEAQKTAKLGSWRLDVNANVLEWSDEIFRIFDETPQSFQGTVEAFYDYVHPDEQDIVRNYFNECVEEKKPYNIVHSIVTKKGSVKHVEENAIFDFDENNNMLIAQGTVQDVTQRIEYQRKLGSQVKQLQLLLKTGGMLAFEVHVLSGEIQFVQGINDSGKSQLPIEYLENFTVFMDCLKDEHRRQCEKKLNKLIAGELNSFSCQFQINDQEASIWYEANIMELDQEVGMPTKMFVVIKNVEEEKNKEILELVGQEKERLRISRDIHDSIGQMLVGTRLMLKTSKKKEVSDTLDEIDEMLGEMIKESRIIINNFGISLQQNSSLKSAFTELSDKMKRVYSGEIVLNWTGSDFVDDLKTATNIFRIFQEALANAIKYSLAKKIDVVVDNGENFQMHIVDYGIGFNVSESMVGFGIDNMKQRASQIGAEVFITSKLKSGTKVSFIKEN